MARAFLTLRRTLLAVLVYLSSLIFIFAIWNISEAHWDKESTPGAAVFLLFNSCFIFVSLTISCIDSLHWKSFISEVRFEGAWAGLVWILQLAAAIAESTTGPPLQCQASATWSLCASATALSQVAWLSSLTSTLYALKLFLSVLGHSDASPLIWQTRIAAVPWFENGDLTAKASGKENTDEEAQDGTARLSIHSIRSTSPVNSRRGGSFLRPPPGLRLETEEERKSAYARPMWAKALQIRPGVDEPFPTPKSPPRSGFSPRADTSPTTVVIPRIAVHLHPHDADVPQDANEQDLGLGRETLLYLHGSNGPLRLSAVSEWSQEIGVNVPVTIHSNQPSPI